MFSHLFMNNNCGFPQELLLSLLLYKVSNVWLSTIHRNYIELNSVNEYVVDSENVILYLGDPHEICAAELYRKLHRFDGNAIEHSFLFISIYNFYIYL